MVKRRANARISAEWLFKEKPFALKSLKSINLSEL
jgi:hypothetical protein